MTDENGCDPMTNAHHLARTLAELAERTRREADQERRNLEAAARLAASLRDRSQDELHRLTNA